MEWKGRVRVVGEVPCVDGSEMSFPEFRDTFLRPNQPLLITGLMSGWQACRDWVTPNHTPNLHFFSTHFGTSPVQVAECSKREFTDQKRHAMTVSEFIDYWVHLEATRQQEQSPELLYLKDWHLAKEYPNYNAYTTPHIFADDWLNAYMNDYQIHSSIEDAKSDDCCCDYRFVYMGPKGTWTPLHADVFRSYSWSGNVCGKKLWHLLPPSETHLLYDKHKRNMVYDIYADHSLEAFPGFQKTCWLECTQKAGEILFVPSGWYHQVTNMEDTISINHNWFNACNLIYVWRLLSDDYKETRASIEDIESIADDFEGLCQRNLAANSGMNFSDFFIFLLRMTEFFLLALTNNSILWSLEVEQLVSSKKASLVTLVPSIQARLWHLLFNLMSIRDVSKEMGVSSFFRQYGVSDQEHAGEEIPFSHQDMLEVSSKTVGATTDDIHNGVHLNDKGLYEIAFKHDNVGLKLFPRCTFGGLKLDIISRVETGQTSNCRSGVYLFHSVDGKTSHVRIKTPDDLLQFIQKILDCLGKQ